jgi:hypothetical protein
MAAIQGSVNLFPDVKEILPFARRKCPKRLGLSKRGKTGSYRIRRSLYVKRA